MTNCVGNRCSPGLLLVMSLTVSFCAVLSPTKCHREIGDLLESDSEGFPTYSSIEIFVPVFF